MIRRTVKIAALSLGALVALGATAYATTGADPGSPLGIAGSVVCEFLNSVFG